MLRVTIFFLFIFISLFAEDTEEFPFIGVTVTTQSIDIQNIANQKVTATGLRYGKQTIDWRTMFSAEFGKNGYRAFSIEIDKILMDNIMGMPKFRPYLGLSIGSIHITNNVLNNTNGYFYGLNTGLLIYTTDNIDTDLSYHYHKVKSFEKVDTLKGGTLSLHYFY